MDGKSPTPRSDCRYPCCHTQGPYISTNRHATAHFIRLSFTRPFYEPPDDSATKPPDCRVRHNERGGVSGKRLGQDFEQVVAGAVVYAYAGTLLRFRVVN